MRAFSELLLALLLVVCLVFSGAFCVSASSPDPLPGEVLFAARYTDYSSVAETGMRLGTSSWEDAFLVLKDGELWIGASSDRKTYLLLPSVFSCGDTYTITYTFRFTDVLAENGYCGLILTSRGDAPSNRTELIFRSDGSVDGYGTASGMAAAAAASENVSVTAIVQRGFLIQFWVQCGDETTVFSLTHLVRIDEGGRGFVLRNASASFSSVEVIHGVDYPEKNGYYAMHSYVAPEISGQDTEIAPDTPDAVVPILCTLCATGAWMIQALRKRSKQSV